MRFGITVDGFGMKKILVGSAVLSTLLVAGTANAADLPYDAFYKAPVLVPVVDWTGLYAGAGLGFRTSRNDVSTTSASVGGASLDLTGASTTAPFDGTAFRASPYIGFNWQYLPQWVVGIEGDVGFGQQTTTLGGFEFAPGNLFTNSPADSLSARTTWDASLRGRFGMLLSPTSLIYLTGGVTWQHYDITSTCASTGKTSCTASGFPAPSIIENSITKTGWTIGGGFETALWGNWIARGEYRYGDFGTQSFTITRASSIASVNPVSDTFDVALRTHTATLGLAYKFGAPIAAATNSTGLFSAFPTKAPPAPPPTFWSGLYAGLGVGVRASRSDVTTTSLTTGGAPVDLSPVVTTDPFDGSAFRASPYIGTNWQVAPQWIVGLEGDFGFTNTATTTIPGLILSPAEGSLRLAADSFALQTTWDASLRGRLGFLITPSSLIYVTGGAAWQREKAIETCQSAGCIENGFPPSTIEASDVKLGWTIGGGFETALWNNWVARAEYRYADYGTVSFTTARSNAQSAVSPFVDTFSIAVRTHTATVGLAYKFDWDVEPIVPIVTKY